MLNLYNKFDFFFQKKVNIFNNEILSKKNNINLSSFIFNDLIKHLKTINYNFYCYKNYQVFNINVLSKNIKSLNVQAEVTSWYEREIKEYYKLNIKNISDTRNLLLPYSINFIETFYTIKLFDNFLHTDINKKKLLLKKTYKIILRLYGSVVECLTENQKVISSILIISNDFNFEKYKHKKIGGIYNIIKLYLCLIIILSIIKYWTKTKMNLD